MGDALNVAVCVTIVAMPVKGRRTIVFADPVGLNDLS